MTMPTEITEPLLPLAILKTEDLHKITTLVRNTSNTVIEVRKTIKGAVLLCPLSKVWIWKDQINNILNQAQLSTSVVG